MLICPRRRPQGILFRPDGRRGYNDKKAADITSEAFEKKDKAGFHGNVKPALFFQFKSDRQRVQSKNSNHVLRGNMFVNPQSLSRFATAPFTQGSRITVKIPINFADSLKAAGVMSAAFTFNFLFAFM